MEATPTDKLKQVQIGDLTTTQLQSTSKLTYIPQDSMLDDAVRIHKAAEAISTFGAGGVLPDSGAISVTVFDDTAGGTSIQPAEGEVWRVELALMAAVNGAVGANTITVSVTDGTSSVEVVAKAVAGSATENLIDIVQAGLLPLEITNSRYLKVISSESDPSMLLLNYTMVAR